MSNHMTPEQVIQTIAKIASDIACQAGVGGMELAGQFVSVLAAHPEKVAPFLAGDLSFVDDDALSHAERGCLSWRAINGQIVMPAEYRAHRNQHDQ